MRVKRFVANSMQEAISRVKADFGKDAVILHTKRIRRGGFLGLLGRTKVEVIAAAESKAPKGQGGKERGAGRPGEARGVSRRSGPRHPRDPRGECGDKRADPGPPRVAGDPPALGDQRGTSIW